MRINSRNNNQVQVNGKPFTGKCGQLHIPGKHCNNVRFTLMRLSIKKYKQLRLVMHLPFFYQFGAVPR
jgi:hypothetical protein